MNADLARQLDDRSIRLRRYSPGEHRAPCPKCARGKHDDALAVKVEHDGGATWNCHRCGWREGIAGELSRRRGNSVGAYRHPCGVARNQQPDKHETLSAKGRELWSTCLPIEPGTVAAQYLQHRRCIIPPGDLRWHPALPYYIQRDHQPIHVGPALVARVTDFETAEPISLHRTWITPTGKADLGEHKPRKMLWNHSSYGVVRLWPDEDVTIGLTIGEGIETCLAAARAGLAPVWATVSAGNLAKFPILPGLEGLTVLVDHDRPNPKTGKRAGIEAARAVIQRYTAAGLDPERDIKVVCPPTEGEDAADLEAA